TITDAGLFEGERDEGLARGDRGEVARPLGVAPREGERERAEERGGEDGLRGELAPERLQHLRQVEEPEAQPSVFLGDGDRGEAELHHLAVELSREARLVFGPPQLAEPRDLAAS